MANTSATGGPLTPSASPAPLEGTAFEDFLQAVIVGVSGLPGASVRPRWQPEPPNMPEFGVDWAALGIVNRTADTFAAIVHKPDGADELRRHEEVEVLTSFYGPNADKYAAVLRDGLQIPQNLEALRAQSVGLVATGDLRLVPELVKERWLRRVDLRVTFRRQIVRRYAVLNIASALVTLNNELYTTAINVTEPPN